jgi:hypothetical protein
MHPLNLDFVQSSRLHRGRGFLLLIAGAIAAISVASWHADLQRKTQALESQMARLDRQATGPAPMEIRIDESVGQEIQRANEVIDQLALPWNRLFSAVEAAALGQVTLLGIAPDAKSGTVQISAETFDAESMFGYVNRLGQQAELANVYLLEHQRDKRAGPRPLRFVVTASWIEPPARR